MGSEVVLWEHPLRPDLMLPAPPARPGQSLSPRAVSDTGLEHEAGPLASGSRDVQGLALTVRLPYQKCLRVDRDQRLGPLCPALCPLPSASSPRGGERLTPGLGPQHVCSAAASLGPQLQPHGAG